VEAAVTLDQLVISALVGVVVLGGAVIGSGLRQADAVTVFIGVWLSGLSFASVVVLVTA
jgi:hypothetical protein